jgi:tRNA G10  N-methylase Trm11
MFAFILGREFRLSLAEIYSLFPTAVFEVANEQLALISDVSESEVCARFAHMGGIIKVIKILDDVKDEPDFMTRATNYLEQVDRTNKVPFAIAAYGEKMDNFATGLRIKKYLKGCEDKSFRLVNKEPKNINSAVYKKEHLAESRTELNYLKIGKGSYMGITIAYQDVDAYAARDMDKTRDMGVGMLPPKLAQTMVNLVGVQSDDHAAIYDPFCGL